MVGNYGRKALVCMMSLGVAAGITGGCSAQESVKVNKPGDGRGFEGWGTSLCWWANRLGYSDSLAQQSAELFYGENGLRLNIMRYNIGGGDDPTHDHITRTDSEVPGWLRWDEEELCWKYDYDADYNQLNVMQRAVKASGEDAVVEVFSNSPPYFMTVSGCSSGAVNPGENNLREDCYDDFAEYLVHVTDYIQHQLGIRVTSISPMNEPNTDFWHAFSQKQEGCHVDAGAAQSGIIEAVARALEKNGRNGNVIIAASDETSPEKQVEEYHAYSQEAKNALGRINTHSYMENGIREMGQLAAQEGFNLWMSEVDGSDTAGENAGEMGAALWFGKKIISDINALNPTAWVMWQVIDSHISAAGYNGNQDYGMVDVNGGFWGLAVADHDNEKIILTQKYYAMGQFTRYIRPGSSIILCNDSTIAAYDEDEKRLTLVAVNDSAQPKNVCYDLSAFAKLGGSAQVIRTSGSMADGEHWAQLQDVAVEGASLKAALKGNAITTFVLDGVEIN